MRSHIIVNVNNNIFTRVFKQEFSKGKDMRNSKAVPLPGIRSLRSRTQKCRVCSKRSKELVNIFDIAPDQDVSIADLLSQSTGLEIFKGDSYPETVCPPCLQESKNSFEIKLANTRSQHLQRFKQDPELMIDLTEEESGIQVKIEGIEHLSEESAPQMEYFQIDEFLLDEVKHEPTEEYISINEKPTKEYVHGQVINEPIEDDSLEEDVGKSSDYEIDPSYLQEQSEGIEDKNYYGNRPIFLTLNVGPNSFAFQCSSCSRLFPTKSKLKLHEYRHKKPTYKCPYCKMAFIYQSLLEQHIRKNTGERPFKCSQCQQDFTTQQQYTIHFKSHPKIPLFKCSHCDLVFKSLVEREEHIITHTKKQLFNCSVKTCQRVFHNKDALKNHVAFYHLKPVAIKCFHCQTDFSSSHELINHIKKCHPEHAQHIPPPEKFFKCLYCEKSYKRNRLLVFHVKKNHRSACGPRISTAKKRKAKSKDLR